jgi:hypothetical protein
VNGISDGTWFSALDEDVDQSEYFGVSTCVSPLIGPLAGLSPMFRRGGGYRTLMRRGN